MASDRTFRHNFFYSDWHRDELPDFYKTRGPRMHMADRDFTETCPDCRAPLMIVEEVLDLGQDLRYKATTITRQLAGRAGVDAYLVATMLDREAWNNIKDEHAKLGRLLDALEASVPIVGFKVRNLTDGGPIKTLTPEEWRDILYALHREHQHTCPKGKDPIVNIAAYQDAARKTSEVTGNQVRLPLTGYRTI